MFDMAKKLTLDTSSFLLFKEGYEEFLLRFTTND